MINKLEKKRKKIIKEIEKKQLYLGSYIYYACYSKEGIDFNLLMSIITSIDDLRKELKVILKKIKLYAKS